MSKLDECLAKTRKLKEIDEDILDLRSCAASPKNQVITGMPRGGAGGNQHENYICRLERLEARRSKIASDREKAWNEAIRIISVDGIKVEYIELLKHRFYLGYKWEKCCKIMCKLYPESNWNMNKVFRVYRQILRKFS